MSRFPGLALAEEADKTASMARAPDDSDGPDENDTGAATSLNELSGHYAQARLSAIAQIGVQKTPSLEELAKANAAVLDFMEVEMSRIETFERRISGTDGMVHASAIASDTPKAPPDTLVTRLWQQNTRLVRLYQELRAVRGRLDRVHS